jgi:hypothetical protein
MPRSDKEPLRNAISILHLPRAWLERELKGDVDVDFDLPTCPNASADGKVSRVSS